MRADLRKLRRPAAGLILMFAVLLGVATVGLAQAADADQWAVVTDGLSDLDTAAGADQLCAALQVTGQECADRVAEQRADINRLGEELVRDQPYAAALQSSRAAPGVAAGLMASWLGVIVIALIAVAHVSSEWQYGTARILLSGRQSRLGFLLSKVLSVCVASLLVFAALAVVLAALGPLLRRIYSVAPLDPSFSTIEFSLSHSATAVAVLVFVSCLSVAIAMLVRHSLAALGVAISLNLLATYLATWPHLVAWSPTFWVASVMQFDASGRLRDHIWPTAFPVGGSDPITYQPVTGYIGMTAFAAVALALSYVWLRRAEVR